MSVVTEIANWGFQAVYKNIWLEHFKWVHDEILNKSFIESRYVGYLRENGCHIYGSFWAELFDEFNKRNSGFTHSIIKKILVSLFCSMICPTANELPFKLHLLAPYEQGGGWGSAFKTEQMCKWLCVTYWIKVWLN